MITPISTDDLLLINNLSRRVYSNNSILSNATGQENEHLKEIIKNLRDIAQYFQQRYNDAYGPFESSVTTGNPIAIRGVNLKRIWSGVFKGAANKQYAAQISFVLNPHEPCLDVGFYFGSAAGHKLTVEQKALFETQLRALGVTLSDEIQNNSSLTSNYNLLFDYGFHAYANGEVVTGDVWRNSIRTSPKGCHIIAKVHPTEFDTIELSTIDSYVSLCISLMSAFSDDGQTPATRIDLPPLTPQQRARQAERLALIGHNGELFALEYERQKLLRLNRVRADLPKHVALESMSHGYDILSIDENERPVYIEVKTTTRLRNDPASKMFFISLNEYNKFLENPSSHRLYRVYDIEGTPALEELDLSGLEKRPDGYIISY